MSLSPKSLAILFGIVVAGVIFAPKISAKLGL